MPNATFYAEHAPRLRREARRWYWENVEAIRRRRRELRSRARAWEQENRELRNEQRRTRRYIALDDAIQSALEAIERTLPYSETVEENTIAINDYPPSGRVRSARAGAAARWGKNAGDVSRHGPNSERSAERPRQVKPFETIASVLLSI